MTKMAVMDRRRGQLSIHFRTKSCSSWVLSKYWEQFFSLYGFQFVCGWAVLYSISIFLNQTGIVQRANAFSCTADVCQFAPEDLEEASNGQGMHTRVPNRDQNSITLQCSFHSELHLVLLPDIKEYKYCWGSASKSFLCACFQSLQEAVFIH